MPGGVVKANKDRVVASIPDRDKLSASWTASNTGQGVIVQNAFKDFPGTNEGDATVETNSFAYYKWTGNSFIKISEGEGLDINFNAVYDSVVPDIPSLITLVLSQSWGMPEMGKGVLVINAFKDYPNLGQGDATVKSISNAYYKWTGNTFIKISEGEGLDVEITGDNVAIDISARDTLAATWSNADAGKGVRVINAFKDYPSPGQGDPTVESISNAYYKWDGSQFLKISEGEGLDKSDKIFKTFEFSSDLFTEDTISVRGRIGTLSQSITNELLSVSYESRLDTAPGWTLHASLAALQTWIDASATGNNITGTIFWIKCLATYKSNAIGEAENLFGYQYL